MNYSVIMEGHNEGLVVTEDGGVASFYEQDDMFNLCLYQTPIVGFNPHNDGHWDELSEGNMYVQLYTKEQLDKFNSSNMNTIIYFALEWLCPNQIYKEVSFNNLFI
jgi:hypothetical protein